MLSRRRRSRLQNKGLHKSLGKTICRDFGTLSVRSVGLQHPGDTFSDPNNLSYQLQNSAPLWQNLKKAFPDNFHCLWMQTYRSWSVERGHCTLLLFFSFLKFLTFVRDTNLGMAHSWESAVFWGGSWCVLLLFLLIQKILRSFLRSGITSSMARDSSEWSGRPATLTIS